MSLSISPPVVSEDHYSLSYTRAPEPSFVYTLRVYRSLSLSGALDRVALQRQTLIKKTRSSSTRARKREGERKRERAENSFGAISVPNRIGTTAFNFAIDCLPEFLKKSQRTFAMCFEWLLSRQSAISAFSRYYVDFIRFGFLSTNFCIELANYCSCSLQSGLHIF